MKMVPQQVSDVRSLTPTSSGVPVFGSQLVDKNSSTPYTDATQVSRYFSRRKKITSVWNKKIKPSNILYKIIENKIAYKISVPLSKKMVIKIFLNSVTN